MKYYLTFSGARYHDTTKRIVEDAPKFGADKVIVRDDHWLRNERPGYWRAMEWFRQNGKGRGLDWFVFKPFVILDTFRRLAPGDLLLYTDADTFPIADLNPLYDTCRQDGGAMLFGARGCVMKEWTKRDAFILTGTDTPEYHDHWQAVARFMVFEKGAKFDVESFLGQWLGFTANPLINTFDPSVLAPEYKEFREARCEQAVLGILAIKHKLKLYREACEFGCWSEPEEGNGGCVPEQYRGETFGQTFSQVGSHSYRPDWTVGGDESEGSTFRTAD